jgi:small nuclear ribonucleoprotein (snRNP)-like protein
MTIPTVEFLKARVTSSDQSNNIVLTCCTQWNNIVLTVDL